MSSFKECVENDITNTFINEIEFAEEHVLDGKQVICIVQDGFLAEDLTIDKRGEYYPDIYGDSKTINIPKVDLKEVPVYGQVMYLDGERYDVVSVSDDMGLLTIVVNGNRR